MQHLAAYLRVSSKKQDTKSQTPDLKRWIAAYADDVPVKWYTDKFSGKTMHRPAWDRLEKDLRAGKVAKIVIWKIDRLGRTSSGLTALYDDLKRKKVTLISVTEGFDLLTPAGRLVADLLAGVAQFENEIRSERVRAGQAVAQAAGKKWGGSKKGRRVSSEKIEIIRRLRDEGKPIAGIARTVELSRPTIYSILADDVA